MEAASGHESRAVVPGEVGPARPGASRAIVQRTLAIIAAGRRDLAQAGELLQRRLPLHRQDPAAEEVARAALEARLAAAEQQRLAALLALWDGEGRNQRIQALKEVDRWMEAGEYDLLGALPLAVLRDYIDNGKMVLLLRFMGEADLQALNRDERFPYVVVAAALAPTVEPGPGWQPDHAWYGVRKFIRHVFRDWDEEDFAYTRHLLLRKLGRRAGKGALREAIDRLVPDFREDRQAFLARLAPALAPLVEMPAAEIERMVRPFLRYDADDQPWLAGQKALVMQRLAPLAEQVIDFGVFPPAVLASQLAVDEAKRLLADAMLQSGELFCLELQVYPHPYRAVELELIAEAWVAGAPGLPAGEDAVMGRVLAGSFDYSLWNILGRRRTFAIGEHGDVLGERSLAVMPAAPFPLAPDLRPYLEKHRRQVYAALAALKTVVESAEVDEHEFFCSTVLPILEAIWRGQPDQALGRIGELGHRWSRTWAFDVPQLLARCLAPLLEVLEQARPPSPAMQEALARSRELLQAECSARLTRVGPPPAASGWLPRPRLEIRLDRDACLPGETVGGVLLLGLPRQTRLRGIQVRLLGKAWAGFVGSNNDVRFGPDKQASLAEMMGLGYVKESRTILEHDLLVAGDWEGHEEGDLEIPPGEYRGRFSLTVAQEAPPSYQGAYAGTSYEVIARAEQGWLWSQQESAPLTVLPLPPVHRTEVAEFNQRYCVYNHPWGDRAHFSALLRGVPYRAGDWIRGQVSLKNLDPRPAQGVSVCLVGVETALSTGRQIHRTHSFTVAEQELCGALPCGGTLERPFALAIPANAPRTASGLFFDFSWSVELRVRYHLLDTLTGGKAVSIY